MSITVDVQNDFCGAWRPLAVRNGMKAGCLYTLQGSILSQIQVVSAVSWERREIDRVYIHSSSDKKPTIKRKNQSDIEYFKRRGVK